MFNFAREYEVLEIIFKLLYVAQEAGDDCPFPFNAMTDAAIEVPNALPRKIRKYK